MGGLGEMEIDVIMGDKKRKRGGGSLWHSLNGGVVLWSLDRRGEGGRKMRNVLLRKMQKRKKTSKTFAPTPKNSTRPNPETPRRTTHKTNPRGTRTQTHPHQSRGRAPRKSPAKAPEREKRVSSWHQQWGDFQLGLNGSLSP